MEIKYITHRQGETFVIYDARLAKRKPQLIKRLGFLSLLISFIGLFVFFSPILTAELRYRLSKSPIQPKSKISGFGQLLWLDEKGILSPADWNFSLMIPKIKINAKVENSVALDEYETALKTGVAHAKGTSLPDQPGTVYIFGHSTDYPWNITRYSAYFYPLRYLNEGEEVIIAYQGKLFLYKVEEKKIVEAKDLEYLVSQNGEKRLVLQTCWPPGTAWKRLIIIASPINET